jgi:hypothetical protein
LSGKPAALHAGVEPEQLVPAEIGRPLHAQPGRVQRERRQRRIQAFACKADRARVKGQMQRAGQRVSHRSPGQADEDFGAGPGAQHGQPEVRHRGPTGRGPDAEVGAGGAQQERDEAAQGPRQRVECSSRKPGRSRRPAAPRHQRDSDRHHRQRSQQQHREPGAPQRGQALQQRQRRGQHQPTGRQHVHARGRGSARPCLARPGWIAQHHRVHVVQVAPGKRGQPAEHVDVRGAAGAPAPRPPQGGRQRGEQRGRQHQTGQMISPHRHRFAQTSLHSRIAS